VGIRLGYLAARHRGGVLDFLAVGGSLLGICTPVFFLAYMLKVVFAEQLGLFPSAFRQTPGINATHVTGFAVLDGMLTREWDAAWDALMHLVLPGIALATIPLAVIVRITRGSVLEVLGEDYVRTAEAKGLHTSTVRRRHVLRNAMLPVVTAVGYLAGGLLAGAVLTESVFAFNGIGVPAAATGLVPPIGAKVAMIAAENAVHGGGAGGVAADGPGPPLRAAPGDRQGASLDQDCGAHVAQLLAKASAGAMRSARMR
jgi:ABC-type dipeptide/oligopeptide/nickel transport system permease component